jgi:secondary thiamine-phosphate synthase enzyme
MEYSIKTKKAQEFINITEFVLETIEKDDIKNGILVVFVPHTTAGVTINENSDPDVVVDIISGLNQAFPEKNGYMHMEGNSHAHIKASVMGASCNIIVENGMPKLGIWQGIYFCEFDGPRNRKVYIKSL